MKISIKEYSSIDCLENQKREKLKGIVWFSNDYKRYIEFQGQKFLILISKDFAISFTMVNRYCFSYGSFSSEPIALNDSKKNLKHFLNDVIYYLKKHKKVHFINPNPAYTNFSEFPDNSIRIPFGNYICDLTLSQEELFKKMHSKHRNSVRKAEKDGVVVKSDLDEKLLADYIDMDKATWLRSGKSALGKDFYMSKLSFLSQNCKIYIAYSGEEAQAGAFIFFDSECGYYMYGANKDHPHTGSGNLLQWYIMNDLKELGVQKYSFVGCRINEDDNSKYHEIQRFKERFGGELKTGYMFKSVLNPIMYWLFKFVLKLKGSKINDAIDQEIHKWKSIN